MITQSNFHDTCFIITFSSPYPIVLLIFYSGIMTRQVISCIMQNWYHDSILDKSNHIQRQNATRKLIYSTCQGKARGIPVI